jgi:hypothetical protein
VKKKIPQSKQRLNKQPQFSPKNRDMGKLPANLLAHRAHMLHDVLPSSDTYRALLAECVKEYDEFKEREKAGRRKVGVRYVKPTKPSKKRAA